MTFDEWIKDKWEYPIPGMYDSMDIEHMKYGANHAWDHQQKEIDDLIFQRNAFQEAATAWMKSYDDLKEKYEPTQMVIPNNHHHYRNDEK